MADSSESTSADTDIAKMEPTELKRKIDAGEPVTILDVRAEEEFEEWRIDGESVDVTNVPYVEFVEGVTDDLLEQVPKSDSLVTVCAKGGASEFVAEELAKEGIEATNLTDGMNGWASIYEARELQDAGGRATVVQYQRPSSGCLGYMVTADDEALVVDPLRAFTDRYVADAAERGVEITYALDTHVHADHVSGARDLADTTGAELVLPEAAVARGITYDEAYTTVEDGDVLSVGESTVEVLHTPGHTSGMTSYLVDDAVLLSGDGLFTESVARPDLEDGAEGAPDAAGQLYDTLQRILELPDDVVVAPAHFSDSAEPAADGSYTARLGDLSSGMSALHMDRAEFVEFILSNMPPRPANFEDIIGTNLGAQETDDEEAFRLELGPNNCAATQDAMVED